MIKPVILDSAIRKSKNKSISISKYNTYLELSSEIKSNEEKNYFYLTGSLLTNAHSDATTDESTDR